MLLAERFGEPAILTYGEEQGRRIDREDAPALQVAEEYFQMDLLYPLGASGKSFIMDFGEIFRQVVIPDFLKGQFLFLRPSAKQFQRLADRLLVGHTQTFFRGEMDEERINVLFHHHHLPRHHPRGFRIRA